MVPQKQVRNLSRFIRETVYPLTNNLYKPEDFTPIRLDASNPDTTRYDLLTYEGLEAFIQHSLNKDNAQAGIGGYLEKRVIYEASTHFQGRSIHLGTDIWMPAGTPVYTPLPGQVHSLAFNDAFRDYGATLIMEHSWKDHPFYTLYGHIDRNTLEHKTPGQPVEKGELLCHLGNREENGGWVPHLHFQWILDMEEKNGDFPGVARPADLSYYHKICPDPSPFFTYIPCYR